ncbi:uncharacterized protein [Clytia hemisphaerica]|uniref:uncharacterized protein n=1 Tax=Clytia hemisphaerica TaxID=252671 RepID=UPI0034D6CE94
MFYRGVNKGRSEWDASYRVTRNIKIFEEAENSGSQITYRCVHCRDCKECKISESIESTSLKEEVEQHFINQSVSVDLKNCVSHANLPLLHNPETKLANNKHKALKVYFQQLRKLDKEPTDKADVIAPEAKLQAMGYVDYVENLTPQQQHMLSNTKVLNFIPWRAVWKPNSISTPCRIVFDASQPTDSGYVLNDILAKGTNNMNRLVEILIRWSLHHTVFHTDIRKMKPTERALRETGQLSSQDYPELLHFIIMKDIYVDDCLSGEKSMQMATQRADELEIVVNRGGFSLKGITFSHQKPKPDMTSDGESIGVAGMKWYPEEDVVSLDVSELNFAKKVRGKKPVKINNVPTKLTRRHCVSKLVPDGTTQPRGELLAATLNAHTGEVVRRAFGTHLKSSLKLTDSQITLFWINGIEKQLKPWVRTRVTEIHRFTELSSCKFVTSENMIADIGTRRGTTISDVSTNST